MEFQSRSYNPGPVFRPKPFVLQRSESSLLIVVSSWGAQGDAEKIAQMISDQIDQADQTPARDQADSLRKALTNVGQTIFKQDNQRQLRLLIEALAVRVEGQSVAWAQVGQPNLYLQRQGRMAPLVVQPDHSIYDPSLPPLPSLGLGLESQTPVQSGTSSWRPGDHLLLLAQAWEPSWPAASTASANFQKLTSSLIEAQPDLAFWCGQASF